MQSEVWRDALPFAVSPNVSEKECPRATLHSAVQYLPKRTSFLLRIDVQVGAGGVGLAVQLPRSLLLRELFAGRDGVLLGTALGLGGRL